jgi:hypothetical protein
VLLPGYAARVARWRSETRLPFRPALDAALGDSGAYLTACLELRAAAAPPDPASYERAVAAIEASLAWLLGCPPDETAAQIRTRSRALFHERPTTPGERLALARQAAELARASGAALAVRWLAAPRKGRLTSGLLELHHALVSHVAGRHDEAEGHLRRAHAGARWRATDELCPGDFAGRWLEVRTGLGRAFWRAIRLGEPDAWLDIARRLDPLGPA